MKVLLAEFMGDVEDAKKLLSTFQAKKAAVI